MGKKELLKHLHSYDEMVSQNRNLSYPTDMVQELMRIMEKEPLKIWLVQQESNVDGEIIVNSVPCGSLETARKVLRDEKNTILNESHHFSNLTDDDMNDMIIEESDDRFFIDDPSDDYYEDIAIIEKELVE